MAEKLNYLQRLIAIAVAFLFWGIAGTLLQIVLYPYTKKQDVNSQIKIRKFVGKIWYYFLCYLQWTKVVQITYQGFERIGQTGQLVVANHPSLLDVVLILAQKKRTQLYCKARSIKQSYNA